MKQKSLLAILIAIVLMGATGCSLFSKNAENIAKGLLEEKYGNNKIKSVNVEQKSADHLRGLVTFQPLPEDLGNGRESEGGIFLAAKVNGEWKLVFDGNGAISCEEMKTYNFPSKMIEDCFSEEGDNSNDVSSQTNESIAKKLLEDKYGQNKIQTVSVEQATEKHLRGLITFQPLPEDLKNGRGGEGGIFLVAKVNGEWKLVFDGNGAISCEGMKPYNFPSKMIEDCFSEENNNENSNIEAEGKMAEEALNKFFAYLSDKEYEKAVSLLMVSDEDWNEMANYTEEKDKGDKTKVLQNYCDGVKTCLNSKVLKAEKEEAGYFKLTVQFLEADGKVFVLPPCCGATEKEMPSQTEFSFGVRKVNDEWKVTRVPLYRP